MQVETLRDLLHWAREHHRQLQACAQHCSNKAEGERVAMLLQYISDHAARLTSTLKSAEDEANLKALNTWCYEYLQKNPIVPHDSCSSPLAELAPEDIILNVLHQHEQIIALYRHLLSRLPAGHAADFLQGLLDLENHEMMLLVQQSQQLGDL